MTPKLGDFVRFAHPLRPAWGTLSGFVIMIITEVDKPPRCEVLVRNGNTGYPTFFWRRAAQLTVLANAKPENQRYLRYSVRHQEETS
jgi:hypothetical protein